MKIPLPDKFRSDWITSIKKTGIICPPTVTGLTIVDLANVNILLSSLIIEDFYHVSERIKYIQNNSEGYF